MRSWTSGTSGWLHWRYLCWWHLGYDRKSQKQMGLMLDDIVHFQSLMRVFLSHVRWEFCSTFRWSVQLHLLTTINVPVNIQVLAVHVGFGDILLGHTLLSLKIEMGRLMGFLLRSVVFWLHPVLRKTLFSSTSTWRPAVCCEGAASSLCISI